MTSNSSSSPPSSSSNPAPLAPFDRNNLQGVWKASMSNAPILISIPSNGLSILYTTTHAMTFTDANHKTWAMTNPMVYPAFSPLSATAAKYAKVYCVSPLESANGATPAPSTCTYFAFLVTPKDKKTDYQLIFTNQQSAQPNQVLSRPQ